MPRSSPPLFLVSLLLGPLIVLAACNVDTSMTPGSTGRACGAADVIDWYGPGKESDQDELSRWCATVGQPVINSIPDAAFSSWTSADSLVVIAWNMNVGGGDLIEFMRTEVGFSCTLDGPAHRTPPFVLLLQEALRRSSEVPEVPASRTIPRRIVPDPWPGESEDIVDIAERCGLALFYVPSMRNGHEEIYGLREDRGNAILSSLPLSDFIAIEIPFEASRKVTVAATVHAAAGDSLRVASVHFDVATTLYRTFTTGNSTRLRQALGFVNALAMIEDKRAGAAVSCGATCDPTSFEGYPIATIAGGDYNTWSEEETALRRLREYFPGTPAWDGVATRTIFPTDYLFFRTAENSAIELAEGSHLRIAESYGSDHHARIAWLIATSGRATP
jgi:endonuclease/exonuclease/phosphatase family metal-dependent hydrolase